MTESFGSEPNLENIVLWMQQFPHTTRVEGNEDGEVVAIVGFYDESLSSSQHVYVPFPNPLTDFVDTLDELFIERRFDIFKPQVTHQDMLFTELSFTDKQTKADSMTGKELREFVERVDSEMARTNRYRAAILDAKNTVLGVIRPTKRSDA